MKTAEREIRNQIATSVRNAAKAAGPDAERAAPAIYDSLAREVLPVIVNQINAEGPFRSRVIQGALVVIIGGGFGVYDLAMDGSRVASDYALHVAAILGGAWALYGRLTAKPAVGVKAK